MPCVAASGWWPDIEANIFLETHLFAFESTPKRLIMSDHYYGIWDSTKDLHMFIFAISIFS